MIVSSYQISLVHGCSISYIKSKVPVSKYLALYRKKSDVIDEFPAKIYDPAASESAA